MRVESAIEVSGPAGRAFLAPEVATDCIERLERNGVVVYRDAALDDDTLVAFSAMLGTIVVPPAGGEPDHPEVSAISLDPAMDTFAAYRRGTFFWHIDGANDAVPQKATLLAAHAVADDGGDTEFANTYAAYEALPDDDKAALADVQVVHSFAASQILVTPDPTPKQRASWDRVPSKTHPLVWTRPNGRRSMLVGATAGEVVGRDPEQGRALLDRLLEWCTQARFVHRHRWRVGDLVVWDNTGMLHRALPYEPTSARLLHRTTLVGEVNVA
jgi:alpha-ketoglutarate-dependent taurine dioxygenase